MHVIYLLWIAVSCAVLVKSADILVRSLVKIAEYFKLTEFAIGFIVVAVATSIPELFVGITSALDGKPSLSLGNIIGANILDMTIVIGVATLLARGIKVDSPSIRTDTIYTFLISLTPIILMADGELSRLDGCLLLVVFGFYMLNVFRQEHRFRERLNGVSHKEFVHSISIMIVALVILFISASYVVKYASLIAVDLSVPPILVGLLIISLGTTLPELTFETRAVMRKHGYMALGDLLGSVVVNTTLVLGVVSLIHPIQADYILFMTSAAFMVVAGFIFMTFVESERYVSWQEGLALIMLYVLFVVVEMNIRMLEVTRGI
ncbi:MAG: sodium:calcium antiporter [Candidatus Altiarchaeota archaeon]